jgi:hypothetical protein
MLIGSRFSGDVNEVEKQVRTTRWHFFWLTEHDWDDIPDMGMVVRHRIPLAFRRHPDRAPAMG